MVTQMENKYFDFQRIIYPLTLSSFFSEYWGKQSLLVTRQNSNYYNNLFSFSDFDLILWSAKPSWGDIQLANNNKTDQWINYAMDLPNITNLMSAYKQGDTIILNDLQTKWKPLAFLCRDIEKLFNFWVNINLYLTPPKSQGLSAHFDTQEIFILQLEGTKRWFLYNKRDSKSLETNSTDLLCGNSQEYNLEPGDMLYIPEGVIHKAETEHNRSMHLTVGITTFRWATLLLSAVQIASEYDTQLKETLPIGFLNELNTQTITQEKLITLFEHLIKSIKIETVVEVLGEKFIKQLKTLQDTNFTALKDLQNINLNTIVKKCWGTVTQLIIRDNEICVRFPGNTVILPNTIESAIRFILNAEEFAINNIPGLTDSSKIILARRLIQEGLLIVV